MTILWLAQVTVVLAPTLASVPARAADTGSAGTRKAAEIPAIKIENSPSPPSEDYVMDLVAAVELARKTGRQVILYTGHNHHLKKAGVDTSREYFEEVALKHSPTLAARRGEYVVCELFEFTPMHDARGDFTPEFGKMVRGWFGDLDKRYDIRFLTPTLSFLDSTGAKLTGPFDGYALMGAELEAALKRLPRPGKSKQQGMRGT